MNDQTTGGDALDIAVAAANAALASFTPPDTGDNASERLLISADELDAVHTAYDARALRDLLDLVDEPTAAAAIGLKETTLAAYRRSGQGPDYVQIARNIFYRREDIKAWLGKHVVVQRTRAR